VPEAQTWQWDRAARHETSRGGVFVREAGRGAPLVLLHPLALSSQVFAPVARELARDFHVLAVDARGHGGSDWDGSPFTIEDMADDLAALLDSLSLGAVSVLGMSMGGCSAIAFGDRFADRVESLVLADTTAWYGEQAPQQWAERARRACAVPRVRQVPFQVDRWFTAPFRRAAPGRVNAVVSVFLSTSSRAHAAASAAMGTFDGREGLAGITRPVLAMTGEEDYATPQAMGRYVADHVADGRFVLLPGVRHLSLIEKPDLAGVVREFLVAPHASPPVSAVTTVPIPAAAPNLETP
jgi:3-oxoadipate enol-lactonase